MIQMLGLRLALCLNPKEGWKKAWPSPVRIKRKGWSREAQQLPFLPLSTRPTRHLEVKVECVLHQTESPRKEPKALRNMQADLALVRTLLMDYPGGLVAKAPPSKCRGDPGLIPGWELRSHMPRGS